MGEPSGLDVISFDRPGQAIRRPDIVKDVQPAEWRRRSPGPYPMPKLPPGPPIIRLSLATVASEYLAIAEFSDLDQDTYADVGYAWNPNSMSLVRRSLGPGFQAGLRVQGGFGFPDLALGASDSAAIRSESGRWTIYSQRPAVALSSVDTPPPPARERSSWQALARSGDVTVVRLNRSNKQPAAFRPEAEAARPAFLYRAASARWEPLTVLPSGGTDESIVRLIGPWLLITIGEEGRGRRSPGREQRRRIPVGRYDPDRLPRPVTDERFERASAYYPGRLVAMDTRNGKTWQVVTNQGDSEPLLVDGTTLYYRVNDRILKAELSANGAVGAPVLLARHDDLRDAHWAFLGPTQ